MESMILTWKTSGILTDSTRILDGDGKIIGSLERKSVFKHRTSGNYKNEIAEFDYDGGMLDNVLVFDQDGTVIGKYEAALMVDEGTYSDYLLEENFEFKRFGKMTEYLFSISKAGKKNVQYEITDQSLGESHGTITILDTSTPPRIILVGLYLAAYNKAGGG